MTELLAELNGIGTLLGDLGVTQEDAAELLRRLPEDLSRSRRAVVETACKLVGKVNYFWGGKSLILGWDSRWGTIQKVWAAGSPSTGTYRPYGIVYFTFRDENKVCRVGICSLLLTICRLNYLMRLCRIDVIQTWNCLPAFSPYFILPCRKILRKFVEKAQKIGGIIIVE